MYNNNNLFFSSLQLAGLLAGERLSLPADISANDQTAGNYILLLHIELNCILHADFIHIFISN